MSVHRVKVIVPGNARGAILKAELPLSFLGGVDPATGTIVEDDHPLRGQSISGKILALPHSKGSTVGSYVLYSLVAQSMAPLAIIMRKMDMVVAAGCVLGQIPLAIVTDKAWSGLKSGKFGELLSDQATLSVSE